MRLRKDVRPTGPRLGSCNGGADGSALLALARPLVSSCFSLLAAHLENPGPQCPSQNGVDVMNYVSDRL
jgi:hypothetical protein